MPVHESVTGNRIGKQSSGSLMTFQNAENRSKGSFIRADLSLSGERKAAIQPEERKMRFFREYKAYPERKPERVLSKAERISWPDLILKTETACTGD